MFTLPPSTPTPIPILHAPRPPSSTPTAHATTTLALFLARLRADTRDPHPHVVHFKGFGPVFSEPAAPPSALVDLLLAADAIAFDGDDFSSASFTRALNYALAAHAARGTRARLLAFKFDDRVETELTPSWAACALPADALADITVVPVALADVRAAPWLFDVRAAGAAAAMEVISGGADGLRTDAGTAAAADTIAHVAIVGTGHTIAPDTAASTPATPVLDFAPSLSPEQLDYVGLGVWGVDAVRRAGARASVVAWGGYFVVAQEFAVHAARWPCDAVRWTYFHASRVARTGGTQAGVLASVRHPALAVVL